MMESFLANDRMLPLFVISVRTAATIFAYELGSWNDRDFTDAELEPFMERPIDGLTETSGTHGWAKLDLLGAPQQARDAIEAQLCQSIDAGHLRTLHERRELIGKLNPTDTLLDTADVGNWAEARGLDCGDWFGEYCDNEEKIATHALESADEYRARLESPDAHEQAMRRAAEIDQDVIVQVLRENEQLRAAARVRNAKPLDARERTTLLCIIGALTDVAKVKLSEPYAAAKPIADALSLKGVRIQPRRIGDHLKRVQAAIDSRKN